MGSIEALTFGIAARADVPVCGVSVESSLADGIAARADVPVCGVSVESSLADEAKREVSGRCRPSMAAFFIITGFAKVS